MPRRLRSYARELNQQGIESADFLLQGNAELSSIAVPQEGAPAISLKNIDRFTAIALASALVTELDSGKPPINRRQIMDDFEESTQLSNEQEPIIFDRRSRDLRYRVLVGQLEIGKYVLQAKIDELYARANFDWAKERLGLGLISVLNIVNLKTGSNGASEAEVLSHKPPRLGKSRVIRAENTLSSKKEGLSAVEAVQKTLKMLGISDADFKPDEALELWESRGGDPLALIDLYIEAVHEKKAYFGKDYLEQPMELQDLIDISRRQAAEDPLDLKRAQEKSSIKILSSLGLMDEVSIRTLFQWTGPIGSLQIRYIAWLSELPNMEPYAHELKAALRTKKEGEEFKPKDLFQMTIKHLEDAYKDHVLSRTENYDFSLGFQAKAYNHKKNNLQAMYVTARQIFR